VLSARPHRSRPALSPSQQAWAAEQAEALVAGLRDAKYHIVGDLADLRPAGRAHPTAAAGPDAAPASQPAEEQLDAAAQAVAALADRYFQARYPVRPPSPHRAARQRASDIKWAVLNGPRVRQVLRRASHHAPVQRLRVIIWCVLMRPGRHPR
jgi:hypothetical protein